MGCACAAGIIAIDLARDIVHVYPSTYALVVSAEAVSCTWYAPITLACFFPTAASGWERLPQSQAAFNP
ncbi:hypothetical protein DITRI_Ditri10aG0192000 [Diplodiscus trichospermus]